MRWDQKLRIDICIFGKFQIVIWNFEKNAFKPKLYNTKVGNHPNYSG